MRVDIIEDDPLFSKMIKHILATSGNYEVRNFPDAQSFLTRVTSLPDVVTLDLGLPDMSGTDLMKKIKNLNPETEVIIISGQDNLQLAVQLLKEGAYDYITKDENIKERVLHTLDKIRSNMELRNQLDQLKKEVSKKYPFHDTLLGNSSALKNTFSLIDKATKVTKINVSILGEPGTGKDLVAKTIHYNSDRKDHPFIQVSISSMSNEELRKTLFGVEKGAWADTLMTTKGKFEEAGEGTLVLDDITDFDDDLQKELLDVFQERKIKRIGGNHEQEVKCRVITTTSYDLLQAVKEKKFREDLYYYLAGLPITMPALRERGKDVIILGDFFLQTFCLKNNLPPMILSSGAKKKLLSHNYPGNIRELKAIIELSAVLANSRVVEERHIVFNYADPTPGVFHEELTLKEYNERIIIYFMKKYKNVMEVARRLDIGKSTIYNLLKKYKEEDPDINA
jgi:DNA-binding NtrC family response regulator